MIGYRNIMIFYISIGILVASALVHMLLIPFDSWYGVIVDIIFSGSAIFLAVITMFIFRPQIKNITSNMELMNNTMQQMQLLKTVATAANEASSINEGLQITINKICEYTKWPVGHAYIYSTERDALISTGAWYLSDKKRYAQFKKVSEETILMANCDFIGDVYADSTSMWILDINNSSVYSRKDAAISAGLESVFAFPIFVGQKAVAVMEFYSHEAKIPDETFISIMNNIGKQLGQIIERSQFEERAKLLETVIHSANDGIIITKANLEKPGPEIIYINDAFTKISGYTAEEVIGRSPRFLQNEFTKRETLDEIKQSLVEGKTFKGEILNIGKNGNNYWLDISIVPVRNSKGIITHFAAIERDITARKQEEAEYKNMWVQLKRANLKMEAAARDLQESLKKAEAANKAKSDFLANMSHELRTPMNGVLGMAQLLADTGLDDEQKDLVNTINSSGENLLMLLNDILDFSKIEANALELENIPYDLIDTIKSTVNLLKTSANKKNIDLITDCYDELPRYVIGDSGRMRQIITNLVSNAIKFTESGYVHISAEIAEENEKKLLNIRVEDTGIGISNDKISTIFDKFTQADASVTRKYGGTGLGLAISKQLVMLMGGTIWVNSVVEKGSTFCFSVPYTIADEAMLKRRSDKSSQQKNISEKLKNIKEVQALLVEDYHINRIFAEKLLHKFGLKNIDVAENGAEALLKYRSKVYDVIFMDCQMPELDGYQATEKIRLMEESTPLHTPIIAMTANAMMGDREKCLKSGMDDYISKPLRTQHLKTILQMLFALDNENPVVANINNGNIIKMENLNNKTNEEENNNEQSVDIEQLRLFTDGNIEEEKSLTELFLEQSKEIIAILEQSTELEKHEAWKSAAHRFKGSSGNFGAMKLHRICKKAEMHFEDDKNTKIEMLNLIKNETDNVKNFMYKNLNL